MKLCVGGEWQWKFGGEHSVGAAEKKHMWNIPERKCHRKNLWGSILRGASEQPQEGCAFVQRWRKKKILQSQQVKDFQCPKRNHPSLNWTHIPGIQSHPISQEKILAQCWGPDSFYIWFHSWKWPPLLSLFSWHIQLHIRSDFPIGALRYGLMRAW